MPASSSRRSASTPRRSSSFAAPSSSVRRRAPTASALRALRPARYSGTFTRSKGPRDEAHHPPGWPRLSSAIYCEDPRAEIDWLCQALGFERRIVVEGAGGTIVHSELTFGEAVVMVADAHSQPSRRLGASPRATGTNTQSLMLYVDEVDVRFRRAVAAGAKVISEPRNSDHGPDYWEDRSCELEDPEGHRWWLCERIRTGKGQG